jgi:hypothetical protein
MQAVYQGCHQGAGGVRLGPYLAGGNKLVAALQCHLRLLLQLSSLLPFSFGLLLLLLAVLLLLPFLGLQLLLWLLVLLLLIMLLLLLRPLLLGKLLLLHL